MTKTERNIRRIQTITHIITDAVQNNILHLDSNNEGHILVYRNRTETSPEGWYSHAILDVATELMNNRKNFYEFCNAIHAEKRRRTILGTVRQLNKADMPALTKLTQSTEHIFLSPPRLYATHHVIGIFDDNTLIGYGVYCDAKEYPELKDDTNDIVLSQLYVAPDYQGNGYGTALVQYIKQVASEKSCSLIISSPNNLKSFFEALLFQHTDHHIESPDNNRCIMIYKCNPLCNFSQKERMYLMKDTERAIRFNVALELVEDIHKDCCSDENITRELRTEMTDLIVQMIAIHEKLKSK